MRLRGRRLSSCFRTEVDSEVILGALHGGRRLRHPCRVEAVRSISEARRSMEREVEYEKLVKQGSYYDELLRMGHVVARVPL